jgi:hypothetical protein
MKYRFKKIKCFCPHIYKYENKYDRVLMLWNKTKKDDEVLYD